MSNELTDKGLAAFSERLQGFLLDYYHIQVKYEDADLCLVKLYHHNGNRITLKYLRKESRVVQYTNNIRVFDQKMC